MTEVMNGMELVYATVMILTFFKFFLNISVDYLSIEFLS